MKNNEWWDGGFHAANPCNAHNVTQKAAVQDVLRPLR
jgi:hypothetical protein